MFKLLIATSCVLALSSAIPKHQNVVVEHGSHNGEYDDGKDDHGALLSSLAHSSAQQAKDAVNSQYTAGSHAAFGVKSSLASAALGASHAAHAALVGKQAILANLKLELEEAEQQLDAELAQYKQTENAAHAAQEAAHHAQNQLSTLTAAVAAAQAGVQHAEQAAAESANSAAVQHSMLVDAKQRIAHLENQLKNAHEELHETQSSAHKAAEAAHIAQANAAAAEAAIKSAGSKDYSSHHY